MTSLTVLEASFRQVVAETASKAAGLGFRRRGTHMRAVSQGNSALIEFQRSRWNSKDQLGFTVNLAVVCGELLTPDEPPMDKTRSFHGHLRMRIGSFLPIRQDKWWEITATTDTHALATEVSELIVREGAPYVLRFLDTKELVALWRSGKAPGLTKFQHNRYLERLTQGR
jgi:Domain of unknown function (DUF4304)